MYTWSNQLQTMSVHLVSLNDNEVPLPFPFLTETAQNSSWPEAILNYVIYVKIFL